MGEGLSRVTKKEAMKDIILQLHRGLSANEAKERFEREIGNITSTEIADIEQTLIDEGLSPEEIKKFCNVHALIFQSALEKATNEETFPSHPVSLFKAENREIEKHTGALKEAAEKIDGTEPASARKSILSLLEELKGIDLHYERKEQLLFPFLEKQGFMGPSKVMWGKDDEIRDMLKSSLAETSKAETQQELKRVADNKLKPLIEEIEGMIFKEENILFPTSIEKLASSDWVDILRESDDVGYVFIEKPAQTEELMKSLQSALMEEPVFQDEAVTLPSGSIRPKELMYILNTLPVDITFVDSEDTVRYFSESKDRIFRRTRSIIGRKVQNCHPPQSVDVVEKILGTFKRGEKDFYEFWLTLKGKMVYIRYFAIRSRDGDYLGTVEVTQDITDIKKLEGEKRLLDERD
jgi:PAS domain S-box-containing protein